MLRYTADLGTDPDKYPHHKCYCVTPDTCVKKGAMDIFKCVNAPIFITNPHFYLADPWYVSAVDGVKPDKVRNNFFTKYITIGMLYSFLSYTD